MLNTNTNDSCECMVAAWRSGNIVWHINEVTLRRAQLVLGWVTVWQINHLSISPSLLGQLSLLPSAGREMSAGHSAGDALWLESKGMMAHFCPQADRSNTVQRCRTLVSYVTYTYTISRARQPHRTK